MGDGILPKYLAKFCFSIIVNFDLLREFWKLIFSIWFFVFLTTNQYKPNMTLKKFEKYNPNQI